MLAAGQSVDSVLDTFRRADDGIHLRQVGIVDADGMTAQGMYDGPLTGAWDDRTEAALQSLFGIENLDERWVGGPAVDPVAWNYLKKRFEPATPERGMS
ncbi:MAG: putative peptidoglycan binding domain-containing protein [Armatimonadota bacterium]